MGKTKGPKIEGFRSGVGSCWTVGKEEDGGREISKEGVGKRGEAMIEDKRGRWREWRKNDGRNSKETYGNMRRDNRE